MRDEIGKNIVAGIIQGITSKFTDLSTTISTTVQNIINWFGQQKEGFVTKGSEMINKIKEGFNNSKASLQQKVTETSGNIKSWFSTKSAEWKGSGSSIISKVKEGFDNNKSILKTKAVEVSGNIKTWLSTKSRDWKTVGSNIVSGIKNGITGATGSLKSTVTNLGSNVLSWLKSKLGIHSPSTVMRDYVGKFIPLGISEGISNEAKSVYNSINELTNGLVDIGKANISSIVGVTYDDISGNIQSQTEVISNISSSDFANKVGQYCYNAITQGFNDNPQNVNVNIGNRKVYEGYGSYQSRQANKYGVSQVTI